MNQESMRIQNSLAPWLSVPDGFMAVDFYKSAFDAIETYRLEMPDGGLIVKLSVNGAEFWISGDKSVKPESAPLSHQNIRMILTVPNPEYIFNKALQTGASEIYPISEGHGWKIGRLSDPFGLHWEIGHPI